MYLQAVGYIKLITVHTGLYTFDSMNKFLLLSCATYLTMPDPHGLYKTPQMNASQIQSAAFTSSSQTEENQLKQNISESLKMLWMDRDRLKISQK